MLIIVVMSSVYAVIGNYHYSLASPSVSKQTSNRTTVNENTSDEPLINDTLQGTIVGAILGFVSSIIVDYTKNWLNRPKISVSEETYKHTFYYPYMAVDEVPGRPTEFIGT